MNVEHLPWDSAFFNIRIGKIENIDLNLYSDLYDYDLIYIMVNERVEKDHSLLTKFNVNLVDVKYTYSKETEPKTSDILISEYDPEQDDINEIYNLSYQSGYKSRFKLDTNIPDEKFKELYRLWIDNTINGTFGKKLFLSKSNDAINGIVTLGIKNNYAEIGVIAVNENTRGMKVGHNLMNYAENNALVKYQESILNVATQKDNIGACRFYEKLNFKLIDQKYIYHLWIQL